MSIPNNASLITSPLFIEFDTSGRPLAGGKLYTYAAGTLTPLATYTDATLTVTNANPVVLDNYGKAQIWFGSQAYKLNLTDSLGVQQPDYPIDNIILNTQASLSQLLGGTGVGQGDALVGVLKPWTGAVATTQDAVNARTYSSFDAMTSAQITATQNATQTVDVTTALQAVITAAPAGTQIALEVGDHLISAPLVFTQQVTFRGKGWRSRIIMASSMLAGAQIYGTITGGGTTLTLAANNLFGSIVNGMALSGPLIVPGTTLTYFSGTANTTGAVYTLSQAASNPVNKPFLTTYFNAGGQDAIYILPALDVNTDHYMGYNFQKFMIEGQGGASYGRSGIRLEANATTGQANALLIIDRVIIAKTGSYSIVANQSTQFTLQNSQINSIALNVGGDSMRIINNGIGNFNPSCQNIYINCYNGANSCIIEKNTITSWYTGTNACLEQIRADACGTLSILDNQFETIGSYASPAASSAAVFLAGYASNPLLGSIIERNNFNIANTYYQNVICTDQVVSAKIHKNQFGIYANTGAPGSTAMVLRTTTNSIAVEFGQDNTNFSVAGTFAPAMYTFTRGQFQEPANNITASCATNQLSISASSGTTIAGQWIQMLGVTAGTYVVSVTNAGVAPCMATLSAAPGSLTSRTGYAISKMFNDSGVGTIGLWKLITLPSSGYVLPATVFGSGYPAYCKINDELVVFAGGANISTPSEGMGFNGVALPSGFLTNNYAFHPIMGYTTVPAWAAMGIKIDYTGSMYLVGIPALLQYVSLEGVQYRHVAN
jgi:hypothetical protein